MADQTTVQGPTRLNAPFMLLSGAVFTLLYLSAVSVTAQDAQPQEDATRKLAALDAGLAIEPGDAALWLRRGQILAEMGRLAEARVAHGRVLELLPRGLKHDEALLRVMALWQVGRRDEAWSQYQEVARVLGGEGVLLDPAKRRLADLRRQAARVIGAQLGPEPMLQDIATRNVGFGDYPQWGGWAGRNNVGQGEKAPLDWHPGEFDRKTDAWISTKARNIKWVAKLGSQTYGNPSVANGKIFVGTNNSHGYLKAYPPEIDLGVLLCFREADGEFLWQHSAEKLSTGRVHDWPLVGMCSSPLVEGDRLWVVTNRGEVVCLDTEGFHDGEDDGPVRGLTRAVFQIPSHVHSKFGFNKAPPELLAALARAEFKLPANWHVNGIAPGNRWIFVENERGRSTKRFLEVQLVGEELQARPVDASRPDPQPVVAAVSDKLWDGMGTPAIVESLRGEFQRAGLELPPEVDVKTLTPGKAWTFDLNRDGGRIEVVVRHVGPNLVAVMTDYTSGQDRLYSDIVWSLDMMQELGVSQHNMATCAPTAWKDTLFICTSNGVDESHLKIPAPEAPSFIALDKHTGKVLWTDNSPGSNIQHGQWSAPAVGVFAGVPQVIFGGGDGWMYSFHAEQWRDGKPTLLWKFDINPKESMVELGGRGTRNEPFAVPVVYDGFVYVTTGQDPEHGEGLAHLWCIDPTRRGDVSPQLAVKASDRSTVLPHRRVQAVVKELGEVAIDNPNSAAVWSYSQLDARPSHLISRQN